MYVMHTLLSLICSAAELECKKYVLHKSLLFTYINALDVQTLYKESTERMLGSGSAELFVQIVS